MKDKFEKDSVVLLNKAEGITSFGAINKLKRILNCKKVGHGGTLDPMAEGLLIVMVNNATKFSEDLMKQDKEYYVEMVLGYETDTYDREGQISRAYYGENYPDLQKIQEMVEKGKFLGEIEQVPPMYSAIKVNGEKLYDLARKGLEIERKSRKVTIHYIKDLAYDSEEKKVSFRVGVSSGTYIRSLVKDMGVELGVYATMTKLLRTKIGKFSLDESVSLENIKTIDTIDIEEVLDYKNFYINSEEYKKIHNGMTVLIQNKNKEKFLKSEKLKLYLNAEFVGIGKIMKIQDEIIYLKRDKYMKSEEK